MVYAVSVIVLVAIFAVATLTPINMGLLAFAGAFVVGGWVSGISMDTIFDAFPASTFILLTGITLLFAIAKANGTLDVVIDRCLRLVGGRRWAMLCMMFALSGLLMALGSVVAPAMLAPVAMPLAAKNKISPFLMGMVLNHGAFAFVMSPVNLYGAFVGGVADSIGVPVNRGLLFMIPFVLNVGIALVLYLIHGRPQARRDEEAGSEGSGGTTPAGGSGGGQHRRGTVPSPGGTTTLEAARVDVEAPVEPVKMNRYRFATLIGIAFLAVGSVGFGIDVGVSAICIGAILLLMSPKDHPKIVDNIAWQAVVVVCGMLTYMAVLDRNGTLDLLGDAAAAVGSPLITALILCYVVAVMSAFGSSIGTLGIALPLAMPLLAAGDVGALGFIAALAFCATVVDVSPFTTNSVMIIANAEVPDKPRFQRKILAYCGLVVLAAPLFVWGTVVLPTSI